MMGSLTCCFCFFIAEREWIENHGSVVFAIPALFLFSKMKRKGQRHGKTFYPLQRRWTANRNGKGEISKPNEKMGA